MRTTLKEIQEYLGASNMVAFDFETAPLDEYRHDDKAPLDLISGYRRVSCQFPRGQAVYVPLRHRTGGNADSPEKNNGLAGLSRFYQQCYHHGRPQPEL